MEMNPYLDIILRCIGVYLFMVAAIRVFGKKELAQLSVIDLVFILLISNAVQNAMVGPSTSLGGGITAAAALFLANFTLKKLIYKNQSLSQLLQGDAMMLIYKGNMVERNLRKAQISIQELEAVVREHGVNTIQDVDLAMLEVDGNVSIISKSFQKHSAHKLDKYKDQAATKAKV